MSKTYIGTFSLILICCLYYIFSAQFGLVTALSFEHWYYLVLAQISHADSNHLMGNMLILSFCSPLVEKSIGTKHLLGLFFFSGCIGSILSLCTGIFGSTLGASIGIFGIVAMYPFIFSSYTERFIVLTVVLFYFFISLKSALLSLVTPLGNINHIGHCFGFSFGLIYTLIFKVRMKTTD